MANPRNICAAVLIIGLLVGIILLTGWDFGLPGQEGTSGSIGFVFYDENGEEFSGDLAYMSSGVPITGFRTTMSLSAAGNVPLSRATFTGVYRYKIYGINDVQETETLRSTVEVLTFNVVDYDEPMTCHDAGNWYTSISILDAYSSYKDTGGWKIVAEIDATVTAINTDGETIEDDWSGSAYFCVWWQQGSVTLTGEIGFG